MPTHPFVPNVEARNAMDDNQVDEFKEAFRVFDTDHGGTIDAEEYSNLMAMLGMVRMLLVVVTLVDGWFGGGGGVVVVVLLR